MMLRAGTPSVPSSAIGKDISLPADASSVGSDESTGVGTSDRGATVLAAAVCMGDLDQDVLTAPSQNIAPSIRFGMSATKMRPATNARMADKESGDTGGVWSARMYFALRAKALCAGCSTVELRPHGNRPSLGEPTVGTSCRRM